VVETFLHAVELLVAEQTDTQRLQRGLDIKLFLRFLIQGQRVTVRLRNRFLQLRQNVIVGRLVLNGLEDT